MRTLTTAAARRAAIAAQGFLDPRPAPWAATARHLDRVVRRVGVVQIDSVNVLVRSHYLPFYSRLGPYRAELLDRARDARPHRLVEYWAHEASLIPPTTWPLFDARMRRAHLDGWGGMTHVAREEPALVEQVADIVAGQGPLTAREVEAALAHTRTGARDGWGWNWSAVKRSLEYLFWAGRITSAGRTRQFERRYAALSVVAPTQEPTRSWWLDSASRPDESTAVVELLRISAAALAVATARDLRDYFRLRPDQVAAGIATLVATGELVEVTVPAWPGPAYLWAAARVPRAVSARALLSPFDSLVWHRPRVASLFEFDYRLEIYVPAHRRVHGYYVLPFLLGDRLVGRVDLKADRDGSVLQVRSVHLEPDAPRHTAAELAQELRSLADWLGLTDVSGGPTG